MIVLGIDPGYAITGYGIIEYKGGKSMVMDYGAILTDSKMDFSERLLIIFNELNRLIKSNNIDFLGVEELFFNKNTKTAIKVAEARGIILLCGSLNNIATYEYTPLQVKQAVCGYGRADKNQVQQMVKALLHLKEIPKPDDVADALAVALCHAHSYNERLEKK